MLHGRVLIKDQNRNVFGHQKLYGYRNTHLCTNLRFQDKYVPIQSVGKSLATTQPDTDAAALTPILGLFKLQKRLEKVLLLMRGDSRALVSNISDQIMALIVKGGGVSGVSSNLAPHTQLAAHLIVFDGVLDHMEEYELKVLPVSFESEALN